MIIYFHRTASSPPPWLKNANNLSMRHLKDGYGYGIGPAFFIHNPPEDAVELEGGWKSYLTEDGCEPEFLVKENKWYSMAVAQDTNERNWTVPRILGENGNRAFRVAYGTDFLPKLTTEQSDLFETAQEARVQLKESFSGGKDFKPMDMQAACAWAAKFIQVTNHLNVEVMMKHGLLDDRLVIDALMEVCSFHPVVNDGGG